MSTQEEIIEMPEYLNAAYEGDDLYTGDQVRELIRRVADKKEAEMQERIDKLHNMYELVCQHRDMLMAQQDAMIAALRGKLQ